MDGEDTIPYEQQELFLQMLASAGDPQASVPPWVDGDGMVRLLKELQTPPRQVRRAAPDQLDGLRRAIEEINTPEGFLRWIQESIGASPEFLFNVVWLTYAFDQRRLTDTDVLTLAGMRRDAIRRVLELETGVEERRIKQLTHAEKEREARRRRREVPHDGARDGGVEAQQLGQLVGREAAMTAVAAFRERVSPGIFTLIGLYVCSGRQESLERLAKARGIAKSTAYDAYRKFSESARTALRDVGDDLFGFADTLPDAFDVLSSNGADS